MTTALTMVKMALLAPMPSASVAIAIAAKPGERTSPRQANAHVMTKAVNHSSGAGANRGPRTAAGFTAIQACFPGSNVDEAPLPGRDCANPNSFRVAGRNRLGTFHPCDSVKALMARVWTSSGLRHDGFV